ncbi:hypothetical protein LXA43DRAFT_1159923 [Ganoderma leucocontextum]|nr:hypothetical protein LXA43DRAFT_1159923 [Ganoderma leucocontextum]
MMLHSLQAPILLCPDILVEILNHLHPGRCSPQETEKVRESRLACRRALRASALTCHTLYDLALDVLWRALDDMHPLLHLLPRNKRHDPTIVLKSRITPETWMKLQRYATRVREIGSSPRLFKAHQSVWQFLAMECKGSPLLPRLSGLDALGLSSDDLPALFLLLSPSVRSLSLSFKGDSWPYDTTSDIAAVALHYIAQTAPGIKSFHMSGFHLFSGTHLSALQNLAVLTELSLGSNFPLNGALLRQLSMTSSLNALTIAICGIDSTDLQSLSDGFRSLHNLTIRGDLEHLVNFILACRLPCLDGLTLQTNDFAEAKQFRARLASICEHPGLPRTLTRIGCEFFSDTTPSFCDADLIRLGDAWANLQHLDVRRHPVSPPTWHYPYVGLEYRDGTERTPRRPAPTLFGLLELTRRCPALGHVHLPELDASTLPQSNASRPRGHPIREISFDSIRYAPSSSNPCAVADVLDLAFPRLDVSLSISEAARNCDLRPGERVDSRWGDVLKFVRAMQLRRGHLASDPGAEAGGDGFAASTKRPAHLDSEGSKTDASFSSLDSDSDSESESDSGSGSTSDTDCESEGSGGDVDAEW